jgi:hypothetical protein
MTSQRKAALVILTTVSRSVDKRLKLFSLPLNVAHQPGEGDPQTGRQSHQLLAEMDGARGS